jgi:hypothetical protein
LSRVSIAIETRGIHDSDLQLGVVAGIEELGALFAGVLVLDTSMSPQHKSVTLITIGSRSARAVPTRVASATKENFMMKCFADLGAADVYSE